MRVIFLTECLLLAISCHTFAVQVNAACSILGCEIKPKGRDAKAVCELSRAMKQAGEEAMLLQAQVPELSGPPVRNLAPDVRLRDVGFAGLLCLILDWIFLTGMIRLWILTGISWLKGASVINSLVQHP